MQFESCKEIINNIARYLSITAHQEAKSVILRTEHAETAEVQVRVGEEGAKDFVELVPTTMEVEEEEGEGEEDVEITAEKTRAEVLEEKVTERIELEDSEEEETVTLLGAS